MKKPRKNWDRYFLDLAKVISTRATCDRLHVGAVIVNDNRIIATGYNGSLPGAPHCDDIGHLMLDCHCKRTTHAEMNAIAQAAAHGMCTKDSHIYITHAPCTECFRMIVACGIKRISFSELYTLKQKHIDLYNEIAGYSDEKTGGHSVYPGTGAAKIPETIERDYQWNISLDSKVWHKS